MSEPTTTRKVLRRAIATELGMPFFRRFSAGELTTDTGSTVSKIVDAGLTQRDGFWNNSWFYAVVAGEQSLTRSFQANDNSLILETPLTNAPADTGDTYELHALWPPSDIHAAINQAIQESGKIFSETVVDATLVLEENQLEYSLTSLTKTPFVLNKVWLEQAGTIATGTATAGGATSITVQSVPSDIDTGWKISIYAGTGSGQIRAYVSNAGNVITVAAWTTNPDSTSKYAIWDASQEIYDWQPMHAVYTDSKEFPDVLRFRYPMPQFYGMRIKLEYQALPSELSSDTDTTIVPKKYVMDKAIAILHGQKLNDTKADRDLHYAEFQRYNASADAYLARTAPHMPDTQIQTVDQARYTAASDDPLLWSNL